MKNTTKAYLLVSLLIIFEVVKIFILDSSYSVSANETILTIFWIVLCGLTLLILKYPRDKAQYKSTAIKMIIVSLLFTILTSYLLGFFIGFSRNLLHFNLTGLIKLFIPIILTIISREIVRYVVAKNSIFNKKPIILLTIVYIMVGILNNMTSMNTGEEIFIFICVTIIPTIAEELLCSYLVYEFGVTSSLVYCLPMGLYPYILPLVPKFGYFLHSILYVILPFMVFLTTYRIVRYRNRQRDNYKSNINLMFTAPIIIFLLVIVILVSGIFNYKLIAIATGSMSPTYDRGDAIIYKKVDDIKTLKEGEVIAFNKNNIIVTHRIAKIYKNEGKIIIKTKGDFNKEVDDFYVEEEEVLGQVKYVVKYVGFPTVLLNEFLKGV